MMEISEEDLELVDKFGGMTITVHPSGKVYAIFSGEHEEIPFTNILTDWQAKILSENFFNLQIGE